MEARARRLHKRGEDTALFEIMEKRGRNRLTSGVWARALDQDDKVAMRIVERAVKALGTGVASAVNLLDVEAVVIGGGLGGRLGQEYADRIAAAMQPHLFVDDRPPVVRVAALGDLGGAIGASLLARGLSRARRPAAASTPPAGRSRAAPRSRAGWWSGPSGPPRGRAAARQLPRARSTARA